MPRTLVNLYRWLFARLQLQNTNLTLFRLHLRALGEPNFESVDASGEKYIVHHPLPRLIRQSPPILFDIGSKG